MSVFYDAWQCPIVTFLIILSIARYTKLWKGLGNTIEYIVNNNSSNSSSSSPSRSRDDVDTYTLDELENKGEYWRILNSTFNIQNPSVDSPIYHGPFIDTLYIMKLWERL